MFGIHWLRVDALIEMMGLMGTMDLGFGVWVSMGLCVEA